MADIYCCPTCGKADTCDCLEKMLRLRKELDPDAPDAIVFPGREIRQRHPRLGNEDYQRIQETLNSLPECPTEEEAEAILQAHGMNGREVINGFIERMSAQIKELEAERDVYRDLLEKVVGLAQIMSIDGKSLYGAPLIMEIRQVLKGSESYG